MQASFEKILIEPTKDGGSASPTDNQIKISILAFSGKTVGEIRSECKDVPIENIGKAIRAVRDAIRAGRVPERVRNEFPELVGEQVAYGSYARRTGHASPHLAAKLNAASRGLEKPQGGRLAHWLDLVKERFAPILVPLTLRKLAEAVERGEPEAIKISTQAFQLVPSGRGPMIAQKFEFGSGGSEQQRLSAPQKENPYFESLLRKARATIDAAQPALQAGDMPDEVNESDDE